VRPPSTDVHFTWDSRNPSLALQQGHPLPISRLAEDDRIQNGMEEFAERAVGGERDRIVWKRAFDGQHYLNLPIGRSAQLIPAKEWSETVHDLLWEPTEAEVTVARRVISFLEDRRVLYAPYEGEEQELCVESVLEIRKYLTEELGSLSGGDGLRDNLGVMRAASRKFMTTTDRIKHDWGSPFGDGPATWSLNQALGELRGAFGIQLAHLSSKFGLDLPDDLAGILPVLDEEQDEGSVTRAANP
jgi:hypothetical protein